VNHDERGNFALEGKAWRHHSIIMSYEEVNPFAVRLSYLQDIAPSDADGFNSFLAKGDKCNYRLLGGSTDRKRHVSSLVRMRTPITWITLQNGINRIARLLFSVGILRVLTGNAGSAVRLWLNAIGAAINRKPCGHWYCLCSARQFDIVSVYTLWQSYVGKRNEINC